MAQRAEGRAPQTRQRIFAAAKSLIERQGAEALTVRAICKEAGISNGSFFYQFPTKDALLAYFVTEGFDAYVRGHEREWPEADASLQECVLGWYVLYARYCEEAGPALLSAIYVPTNRSLAPEGADGALNILISEIVRKISSAQEAGLLASGEDPADIAGELCSVVKGSVFEWCIVRGGFDLEARLSHLLRTYLAGCLSR